MQRPHAFTGEDLPTSPSGALELTGPAGSEGEGRAAPARLCFVALNAYGALSARSGVEHIGGAEVQQVTLARGLSSRFEVSFVVADHGQQDAENCGGITAFKAFAPKGGWPGLRFFHPRLTGLWRALRRADADVYYQRMAETTTGIVAAFCRRYGRKFIFATAAHYDCLPRESPFRTLRDDWLYRYGLRRADRIFVQTQQQQALMHQTFGHDAEVVRNCGIPIHDAKIPPRSAPNGSPRVLWIGRINLEKRPFLALDVAERCPSVIFDVIGDGDDPELGAQVRERAARLRNVVLHGFVRRADIPAFYGQADLLLCTSEREGFPNVFLEAFVCGVPVVSTVDPDLIISRHALGGVGSTPDELAAAVRELTASPTAWRECSERARLYHRRHHDASVVLPLFERHVAELAPARR